MEYLDIHLQLCIWDICIVFLIAVHNLQQRNGDFDLISTIIFKCNNQATYSATPFFLLLFVSLFMLNHQQINLIKVLTSPHTIFYNIIQRCIWEPAKHPWLSFFMKTVKNNYFQEQLFSQKSILIDRIRRYQEVRNARFSENLVCFVFLKHSFWDSPFYLITDEMFDKIFNTPQHNVGEFVQRPALFEHFWSIILIELGGW